VQFQKMTIRTAEIGDLSSIVSIYNETIPGRMVTADLEPVTVESRLDWFNTHNEIARPLWVVLEENNVIAWASFQSFYGRPAYRHTAEISIYITRNHQGKGIGKMLLKKAIEACPTLDIKNLLGFIFGHNTPSIKLFQHFGFENWALLPGVAILDGVERDLIILGKKI
jgi:L-amino acid N-acyltransferase YncA